MQGQTHRVAGILCMVMLAAGCAKRYPVEGVVLRSSPERNEVTISHRDIAGYMPAMVMPFKVRDPTLLQGVNPGDRIEFRLVVSRSESYVDQLSIVSAARSDAGLLRSPASATLAAIGTVFPDFALLDQNGKLLTLSALRGQVVVVNFVYTRCPLPDYCPLLMGNFAALKERFAPQLGRDVTLLTITFDPKYDTQEILAHYGARYGAGAPGWYLLTGTTEQIQRVTEAFGIEYWPDEGLITHSLQTAVIDREGRLYATLEGKGYSIQQLIDVVQAALGP